MTSTICFQTEPIHWLWLCTLEIGNTLNCWDQKTGFTHIFNGYAATSHYRRNGKGFCFIYPDICTLEVDPEISLPDGIASEIYF